MAVEDLRDLILEKKARIYAALAESIFRLLAERVDEDAFDMESYPYAFRSFEDFKILACFLAERAGLAHPPTSQLKESPFYKALFMLILWQRDADSLIAKGRNAEVADISRASELIFDFCIYTDAKNWDVHSPFTRHRGYSDVEDFIEDVLTYIRVRSAEAYRLTIDTMARGIDSRINESRAAAPRLYR